MKIASTYGTKWTFVAELDDGRMIEMIYNPRTDGANINVLGKDYASLTEIRAVEDMIRPIIIEKLSEQPKHL